MASKEITSSAPANSSGDGTISSESTENMDSPGVSTTKQAEDTSGGGVRVRGIVEINGNVAQPSCPSENKTKRKLPEWMLTQCAGSQDDAESSTQMKKIKTACVNDNSASEAENDSNNQDVPAPDQCAGPQDDAESSSHSAPGAENDSINQDAPLPDLPAAPSEETQVKSEPAESTDNTDGQCSSSNGFKVADIKPAVKVEVAVASSSSRESCQFGIRCYRRNQMHRIEEAHPGDHDYRRPSYLLPPLGTPACPYGDRCYRRNPVHFQQYSHPENTDFDQNFRQYSMSLRQRRRPRNTVADAASGDTSDLDEYDLEDPFIDDSGSEFNPSSEEEETEEFLDGCDDPEE